MQTDPLRKIAEDIVADKDDIDESLRERMINELVQIMERFINKQLVSQLNDTQAKEFSDFLDSDPSDEQTVQFFKDKNIDVDKSIVIALQSFKDAYLGS